MPAEPRIDSPAPESAGLPRVSIPADLQAAREARRWSRLDVARLTKFQVRQIAALEEGHFEQLPGRAFVRAALRSYAAVLEVDVTPLLASIGGYAEPAPLTVRLRHSEAALQADMGAEYEPANRSHASRWFWGMASLAVVVALGVWYGSTDSGRWQPRQWFDGFMSADKPVESLPSVRRASGKVTESVTWSWAPAEQVPAAGAAGSE